ncbi:rho guanine nucleotide exchange factor 39 isoform X1 [Phyllobates terribilis]|uniref:rho guanine nucleotide exchange factor 39 isoform X1 n=1 Tax=Phyllobates terribilis TaxID=111132 RepID=UPI003CCA70CE
MESPVRHQRRRWERKRGRTARELLETERAYVEELELITKFYDEVFRARCGNMKLAQEGICGTIPSIVKVNRSLLMSLERNVIPSGFHNFSQYLHLYKKHGDCIGATQQAVQIQIKKKKSFSRFMKLQESRPELQGRTLEKLLELPLQRVMRYRHYLQDLLENTFPGSSDSAHLNGALLAVTDVCDHIENLQQLKENDQQLRRVQGLLKGRRIRILSPGRLFIRDGWLSLVPPSGEDVKHRMLFLFSDVLLVTAPCHPLHPVNAHKFCCRGVYPLRECQVEKVLGHTQSQGGLLSKENVSSTDLHCRFKGIEESKLSVNRKIVREYLANINEFKSPGPDELHPRVLKEIVEEILEPLSIIFENSWRTGEVPEDWRRANVVPIFKKGKKVDPGNYRPLSFRREKLLFMSSNQQEMNGWYESLVMAVRKLHTENCRQTRTEAAQRHQPIMTEIQKVPAARAPKRHHVDSPVPILRPSVSLEDPSCKRLKTSERLEEDCSQAAMSDEGSGWKCVIF